MHFGALRCSWNVCGFLLSRWQFHTQFTFIVTTKKLSCLAGKTAPHSPRSTRSTGRDYTYSRAQPFFVKIRLSLWNYIRFMSVQSFMWRELVALNRENSRQSLEVSSCFSATFFFTLNSFTCWWKNCFAQRDETTEKKKGTHSWMVIRWWIIFNASCFLVLVLDLWIHCKQTEQSERTRRENRSYWKNIKKTYWRT